MAMKIPRIVTERASEKYVSGGNMFSVDSLAKKETHAISLKDGFYNKSNQAPVKVYRQRREEPKQTIEKRYSSEKYVM